METLAVELVALCLLWFPLSADRWGSVSKDTFDQYGIKILLKSDAVCLSIRHEALRKGWLTDHEAGHKGFPDDQPLWFLQDDLNWRKSDHEGYDRCRWLERLWGRRDGVWHSEDPIREKRPRQNDGSVNDTYP